MSGEILGGSELNVLFEHSNRESRGGPKGAGEDDERLDTELDGGESASKYEPAKLGEANDATSLSDC